MKIRSHITYDSLEPLLPITLITLLPYYLIAYYPYYLLPSLPITLMLIILDQYILA